MVRVCGVGIVPREIASVIVETGTVGGVGLKRNVGKLVAETIVEKRAHRKAGGKPHWATGREKNMVAGITSHELIEERRRNVGIQTGNETCSRTHEVGGNVLKTGG